MHLRDDAAPVLVREGFAPGAALFGPFWLALRRAWVPAALALAAWLAVGGLTSGGTALVLGAGLILLQGLFGNDLRRWSLARRRFTLVEVVAARNADTALARLLDRRRDLADRLLHTAVA